MDAPCGDPHPRADLEQPQAQRRRAGTGKRCRGESPAKAVVENVSVGREVKPVGIEQVGRSALGEQVALQFLHAIFRIAPGTVEALVKGLARMALRTEGRDDVSVILLVKESPSRLRPWVREELRPWQPPGGP